MNLRDLIDAFRDEATDNGDPPLWSDARLIRFANEAQIEACRRGQLLTDSTSRVCEVAVPAGDPMVTLDRSISNVVRARLASTRRLLQPVTLEYMDSSGDIWEDASGTPFLYVTDCQTGVVRLYPTPTVDDSILLTVQRYPLDAMAADTDEPEIRTDAHYALVQWMLYRAYNKQDADGFNPQKAKTALAEFESEFGRRSSARNEAWRKSGAVIGSDPIE
jgi:hypothetical protein